MALFLHTVWSRVLPSGCKGCAFVGRSTIAQSTDGQSQPSVSSMELHRTLYSPLSKASGTSARSFALTIDFRSFKSLFIQDLFELLAGLYQWKEHDRLSVPAVFHHLVRDLVQRYGSRAVAMSPALKSPDWMDTPDESSCSGIVMALSGIDNPPGSLSEGYIHKPGSQKILPRLRISPRSGVAVTPQYFCRREMLQHLLVSV